MLEFDDYSGSYRELVTKSVHLSGEPAEYFASYKAKYMERKFGAEGIQSILDYGCGVGTLAEQLQLAMPAVRIDGYDPSQHSLDRVPPQLQSRGLFRSDLSQLANDYDLIVIANVLHHVQRNNRQYLIQRAFQKLKPGGRVVVFEHNPFNPLTRWAVSQCPFDAQAILLTSSEASRLLWRSGFDDLKRDFIVFFPRVLAICRPLESSLGWLPLGAQYVVNGRRIEGGMRL